MVVMVRRFVLSLTLLVALPSLATTYYVNCNGSDSNAGTSPTAAWRTVGKVNSSSFSPGDSILFNRGCTFTDTYLYPHSSGTASNPITFSAYGSGAQPIIDGQNTLTYTAEVGNSYLVIDNMHFTRANLENVIAVTSNHVTLQNSTIDHGGKTGIFFYGSHYTVSNWTILHNTISNNGATTDDHGIYIENSTNTIVDGNTLDSNYGFGVQIEQSPQAGGGATANNNTVRYNYFHSNGLGAYGGAMVVYDNGGGTPTGNVFYGNVSNGDLWGFEFGANSGSGEILNGTIVNNTFYHNQYGINIHNSANIGTLKNNIIWDSSVTAIYDESGSATMASDYNVVGPNASGMISWHGTSYGTLASFASATGNDTHSKATDPLFTNVSSDNFTLQSSSPAIGAGTNLGTTYQMELDPTSSFPWATVNENSYGSAWEIGAFVYEGGGSGPLSPSGLIAVVH